MTDAATTTEHLGAPSLWRNLAYQQLQWGKTTQLVGVTIGLFATPLIAFALTGSTGLAGLIAGVGQVGALLATLPAGVIADRVNRKALLVWLAAGGFLVWTSVAVAATLHALNPWHLAAALFVETIIATLFAPAESAAIRQVVPAEQMGTAIAVSQGRGAAASLLGGPIGGALYALGAAFPLAVAALTYLAPAVLTALVRRPLNPDLAAAREQHPVSQLREGLRFVFGIPLLRYGTVLIVLLNLGLLGVLTALNLQLVSTGTPAMLIGVLDLVAGAAMLLGAFAAPPLVRRFPAGWLAIVALTISGLGVVGLVIGTELWHYFVAMAVICFPLPAINSAVGGYLGVITPEEMQGRMNAALALGSLIAAPAAPVLAGVLLAGVGRAWTMAIFLVVFAAALAILTAFRPIRRIGRPESWAAERIELSAARTQPLG